MNVIKQHSLGKSLILHLFPGVIGTLIFVLFAPLLLAKGIPAILTFLLTAGVVITPFQLAYLLWDAKRATGKFALKPVVDLREPLPKWQYVVFPLGMILWAFLSSGVTGLLDVYISKTWFSWLPDWYSILDIGRLQEFPRNILLATFWVGLVLNGFLGPIVEELYFRGYLLPRLPAPQNWSPLINISLFSLYHFWAPAQFFSRIISLLPWGYVALRKKNIYLVMITHCAINVLGWLLTWGRILG